MSQSKQKNLPTTNLSKEFLAKQGNLVRVVGFESVFSGTSTVVVKQSPQTVSKGAAAELSQTKGIAR